MRALYFAWVRERVGKAEEELDPPAAVATVGDLIAWLAKRGEGYAHAFEKPLAVRAALHGMSGAAGVRLRGVNSTGVNARSTRKHPHSSYYYPSVSSRAATIFGAPCGADLPVRGRPPGRPGRLYQERP